MMMMMMMARWYLVISQLNIKLMCWVIIDFGWRRRKMKPNIKQMKKKKIIKVQKIWKDFLEEKFICFIIIVCLFQLVIFFLPLDSPSWFISPRLPTSHPVVNLTSSSQTLFARGCTLEATKIIAPNFFYRNSTLYSKTSPSTESPTHFQLSAVSSISKTFLLKVLLNQKYIVKIYLKGEKNKERNRQKICYNNSILKTW